MPFSPATLCTVTTVTYISSVCRYDPYGEVKPEPPLQPDPQNKLFVGNLDDSVKKDDLKKLFEAFGTVVECDKVRDFGFVVSSARIDMYTHTKTCNNHIRTLRPIEATVADLGCSFTKHIFLNFIVFSPSLRPRYR